MKTYIFALAFSALSILSASAQDDTKRRNDVTYSTHNYKHPNKAAAAQKWANRENTSTSVPGFGNRTVASYKQPVPNTKPAGGLVVPHTADENLADRNYKIQRPSVATQNETASEVAASNARPTIPVENE